MALQGNMVTQSGIALTGAYAKVTRVEYDYYMRNATVNVSIFKDQAARDANMQYVEAHQFRTSAPDEFETFFGIDPLTPKNVIEQSYLFLKKFSKFEGWTDVI